MSVVDLSHIWSPYINTPSFNGVLNEFHIGRRIRELEKTVDSKCGLNQTNISSFEISMDIDHFIDYIKEIECLKKCFIPMTSYDDYFDLKKCEIMIDECRTFISKLINLSMSLFNKDIEVPWIYRLH